MDKLKHIGSQLAKGACLAIGLPYGLVILTNVVYGWPCSQEGEDKYKRALQPQRVLKVTYAIAEQLDLMKLLPVYLKWTSFYKTAGNLVKDVQYGINNNTLDVWTHTGVSDDRLPASPGSASHPVVVFVFGGAWGSGDKNMYGLLAQQMIDHLGAVVVVPNYSIYPKGEVNEMIQDLHDTLAFIKSEEFHHLAPYANQQKVILFGHSAGAHLCALSAIDLAERAEQKTGAAEMSPPAPETSVSRSEEGHEITNKRSEDVDLIRDDAALLGQEQGVNSDPSVSSSKAEAPGNPKVVSSHQNSSFSAEELLSSVCGVVGLGGVYHIMDHYHHEAGRGVEDLSPMWRVMNGLDQFDAFSPSERVLQMRAEQMERLPHFYLIHGMKDTVVPPSSTEKFASALTEREGDVTVKMIPDGGHAQLIIDLMDDGRKFHHVMVNLLLEARDRVCGDWTNTT